MPWPLRSVLFLGSALAALPFAPAFAVVDGVEADGIRVFEPGYYLEFDPISALELVYRTPGFNPQESDGGRGLSGVRTNVLINGRRPPPKGQSIRQQLREMPVNSIERIELIDAGARLDIDMQGYPQVVNVVTVPNTPAYYEVVTQVRRSGSGAVDQQNDRETEIQANGSFSFGAHEFTLRGDFRDQFQQSPAGFVSIDPAKPEQRISSVNRSERDNRGLQLGADLDLPGASSLNVTGRVSSWDQGSTPLAVGPLIPGTPSVNQTSGNEGDNLDFSAEYQRPFGEGATLMLALVDTTNQEQNESSLSSNGMSRSSLRDRESGETAARVFVTRPFSERLTLRTELTTAYNYFEGDFRLFENGVEQLIDGSDSRVEEDRRSVEGAVDWNFNDRWTLQSAVGLESYAIESREAASGTRTDPTGTLALLFRPQARTTFTLESQRDIGQLSFGQFLASSNLSSEILTAGASALEPERQWTHSARYDRRFGDVGVLRVTLSRRKTDNPVRSVALSDELIVAQNTTPETLDRLQARIEYPLERFGREDLVLQLQGEIAESDTIDPITGERRDASGFTKRQWWIEMRRDPGDGRLSWGAAYGRATYGYDYSIRSVGRSIDSAQWEGFVEWEPIDGLKLRTNIDGPQWGARDSAFFGAVRAIGLQPTFLSHTLSRTDRTASFIVDWRRRENFEIRASFYSSPKVRNIETLTAFGDLTGTTLANEFARTPRATLRFRVYR